MERNTKIVETEDQVLKAREEASEGLAAKLNAQKELKSMKIEYKKLHKKCNDYRKVGSEKDIEIKRK